MSLFDHARGFSIEGGNYVAAQAIQHSTINQHTSTTSGLMGRQILVQSIAFDATYEHPDIHDQPNGDPAWHEAITSDIIKWVEKPEKESPILWLSGPAIAGKTVIQRKIAARCKQSACLAATFFFCRTAPRRSHATHLFSTLAYQLLINIPIAAPHIEKAIVYDPSITNQSMSRQLEKLIVEPLLSVSTEISTPFVVIIDGLDECSGGDVQRRIIRLISEALAREGFPLSFLISSRRESNILEEFSHDTVADITRSLVLTDDGNAYEDIKIFLNRTSKLSIVLEHRDELKSKVALQAKSLDTLHQALDKSQSEFRQLEEELNRVRADLDCVCDYFRPSSDRGFPDCLDIQCIPDKWKEEGPNWFAVFNPNVKRVLDIGLVHTIKNESPLSMIQFSPDGKYLGITCGDKTVCLFDTKSGAKKLTLAVGENSAWRLCFSPDGSLLATGGGDHQVMIRKINTNCILNVFKGHESDIYSLCFSPNGRLLISGSKDGTIRIWSLNDGTSNILRASGFVSSLAISPNGQLLGVGTYPGVIEIWNLGTMQLIEMVQTPGGWILSLLFTKPDGEGLLCGSWNNMLKYWDVGHLIYDRDASSEEEGVAGGQLSLHCAMDFIGHKGPVSSVAVSRNNQWVASGSFDRSVQLWDSRTATVHCTLNGHSSDIWSVDFNQTRNMLATGSRDGEVRIWTYQTR